VFFERAGITGETPTLKVISIVSAATFQLNVRRWHRIWPFDQIGAAGGG
jgi:hypothetical protein